MATSPKDTHVLRTVDELMATDKNTWEYVTIPAENALGEVHSSIGLNKLRFEPGKTYHVPGKIADYLRERLHVYAKSCVRVLQPKVDVAAQQAVAVGSANATNAEIVDATKVQTIG